MADESTEQNDTQTEPSTPENASTEKMFTQDEIDAVVKKRLDKRNREVERKYEGVDPDEYRSMKAAQEAEELERQKERGEFEQIRKADHERHSNDLAVKDSAIDELRSELKQLKVDDALLASASRRKAINAEQVVNLLRANVRMTESGEVEVIDANNMTRYAKTGDPLTPDTLVDEFLSENPHFVSANPGGTGSQSSIGGGISNDSIDNMDQDQFAELMKSKSGRERYAEHRKARTDNKGYIKMA